MMLQMHYSNSLSQTSMMKTVRLIRSDYEGLAKRGAPSNSIMVIKRPKAISREFFTTVGLNSPILTPKRVSVQIIKRIRRLIKINLMQQSRQAQVKILWLLIRMRYKQDWSWKVLSRVAATFRQRRMQTLPTASQKCSALPKWAKIWPCTAKTSSKWLQQSSRIASERPW